MNSKIIEKLEFKRITQMLSDLAVTEPAKKLAQELLPVLDYKTVLNNMAQTTALVNIQRVKGPLPLTDFVDVNASIKRLHINADLNAQELGNILLILSIVRDCKNFLSAIQDRELDLHAIDDLIDSLLPLDDLFNALNRSLESDGTVLDTASAELNRIRHNLKANELDIKTKMEAYLKNSSEYLTESIITIRDGRYVIPVKQTYKNKFGGVVHDQSASGQTMFVEPEAVLSINNRQQQLVYEEKREIHKILKQLSLMAQEYIDEIAADAHTLISLDFLSAKSLLAKKLKATEPIFTENNEVDLHGARHPLLDPNKVVTNDIELGKNFDTMLITGPNTGGKTIILKTVGILQLMAQSGLYITAHEGSKVGIFREIYADIGDEQSIDQSLSTFSSHMDQIIKIMANVNQDDLVLLDELGAGTDPEEGACLAIAILDYMQARLPKIMITTHYPELKLYGYNRLRTSNASMEFDVKKMHPTYKLRIGIPGQSNAFAIAEQLGMDNTVIIAGRSLMSEQNNDINKMILRLTQQTKDAEELTNQVHKKLKLCIALKNKLQAGLDWYNQQVDHQMQLTMAKVDKIVSDKRDEAEKIIKQLKQQQHDNGQFKINKVIEAKNAFNAIENETQQLAHNKILKKAKKKHDIQPGDAVTVSSYGQTGVVTKKISDNQFEVQIGIIKVKVSGTDLDKIVSKKAKTKEMVVRSGRGIRTTQAKAELDLRGKRYEDAMVELDRYIDSALLNGLTVVTIIHGVGTGAIRLGVGKYLRQSKHVQSFAYAPANEGGTGATIVHLK